MDDAREAFMHATAGDWRQWRAYVDSVLDQALEERHRVDAADLERLYRAPAASCAPFVAHHDVGAEWLVP
jgi:hypothetical protein